MNSPVYTAALYLIGGSHELSVMGGYNRLHSVARPTFCRLFLFLKYVPRPLRDIPNTQQVFISVNFVNFKSS